MMARRLCLLGAVVVCAQLAPAVVHADDKEAARTAFTEGTRRFDLADYSGALEAFKRAYLAYEDPSLLFNIAQCHRRLGNRTEAIQFYRTYLRKRPDAANADEVRRIVATLERSPSSGTATRASVETPRATVEPPRATVEPPRPAVETPRPAVETPRPAVETPRPAVEPPRPAVEPPRATVEPRRPAVAPPRATVEPPPTATHTQTSAPATLTVQAVAPSHADHDKRPAYKKWWVWTLATLGAAAAATGVGLGVTLGRPHETAFSVRYP
jgi:tetratricopeptide (TPR) repeat protein